MGINHYQRRKSLRLPGHDYSAAGYYFVTVCVNNRRSLFGEIKSGVMHLNPAGEMVEDVLKRMPEFYEGMCIDEFVVMPNHIHSIIQLYNGRPRGAARTRARSHVVAGPCAGQIGPCAGQIGPCAGQIGPCAGHDKGALSLCDAMHRFKSMTTALYRRGVQDNGWVPFIGRLWLRSYFDRVIYDAMELIRVREYIRNNPVQWSLDAENPAKASAGSVGG